MVASILDHFHISMADFARLTDRQICELYLHPREKDGSIAATEVIEPSQEEPTLEGELKSLASLSAVLGLSPERAAEMKAQIEAKYAENETPRD